MAPKKTASPVLDKQKKQSSPIHNGTSDEAKRLAAAALSAVKDSTALAAASSKGKIEVRIYFTWNCYYYWCLLC